jgi:hypothetical protein
VEDYQGSNQKRQHHAGYGVAPLQRLTLNPTAPRVRNTPRRAVITPRVPTAETILSPLVPSSVAYACSFIPRLSALLASVMFTSFEPVRTTREMNHCRLFRAIDAGQLLAHDYPASLFTTAMPFARSSYPIR